MPVDLRRDRTFIRGCFPTTLGNLTFNYERPSKSEPIVRHLCRYRIADGT